jgi:Ca2+-binding EF-hand superfamily protein
MKQTKKLSEVGLELFEKFDPDGSGEVSLEEMIHTFSKVGSNWDMADVENFFELIDEDKSGSVDKEEFMQFIADVEAMSK